MDKKYIVRVDEISDDVILRLFEFGTIDYTSQFTNVFAMTLDSKDFNKVKKCEGVKSIRESRSGKF